EVEVKRDGGVYTISFADGKVTKKLKKIGTCGDRNTGTAIRILPNKKYFDSAKVSLDGLERIVRSKAVLLPGVKVTLTIETAKETKKQTWSYPEGMKGYLAGLLGKERAAAPIFDGENYVKESEANGFAGGA